LTFGVGFPSLDIKELVTAWSTSDLLQVIVTGPSVHSGYPEVDIVCQYECIQWAVSEENSSRMTYY
jgi:hypothetical protein